MKVLILLIIVYSAWKVDSNPLFKIHDLQFNGNFSEIIFKTRILLSKYSAVDVSLNETNYSYEFAIMQVHCHHQPISISLENSSNGSIEQYGTNIGFLLKADHSEKLFKLTNDNIEDVQCIIALIAYPKSSPMPGSCAVNSAIVDMIKLVEEPTYLAAIIPNKSCNGSELIYETYYTYIDMMEFSADAYFVAIEKMLYDSITKTYQAKKVPIDNKHLFEKIPGRAIIINTLIKGENGKMTYYVPVASYSCEPNTWSSHCTENDFVKRGFSIVLILFSVVMILNLMAPEFIESILNGMLLGGFITILLMKSYDFDLQGFDYFITVIVGSFVVSAILGLITIYFAIGQFMSKFTLSLFFVVFIMEIFCDNITSAYLEVIIAIILSILLTFVPITCAVFLGSLILTLNISFLFKYGNLHRFMINNFLALTTLPGESINETYFDFIRPNYINYKVSLSYVDFIMLILYIVMSIYFTYRKETFFSGHPEALEQNVIRTEYERMEEESAAWNKARHDDFIAQFGKQHDVGHYGPIKGCKGHNITKLRQMHPYNDGVRYPQNRPPVIDVNESESFHTPPEKSTIPDEHCIHCRGHPPRPRTPVDSGNPGTSKLQTSAKIENAESPDKSENSAESLEVPQSRRSTRPSSESYDQINVLGSTDILN
ncbi:unnamed protein product [Chironomus riparius]|uniref:DUF4203 domain-containing protein n=1 Tax=Chironomus riparius TaxID=315576 RepID=A0A9N9RZM1_9DIPT|nr:unnamed protein product [Chironomus riparius]